MESGIFGRIKHAAIRSGLIDGEKRPRRVKSGLFKGIDLLLDNKTQMLMYMGLHEREIHGAVRRLSQGVSTAVDIGAAEGEYALYFIMRTEAKAVYVCEPDRGCRETLAQNLKLNSPLRGCRVNVVEKYIEDVDSGDKTSLDAMAPMPKTPVLIKVDIDGSEAKLLRGARSLMQMPRVRWVIETHSVDLEKECISILERAGYKTRIIPNAWWRRIIPEQRPIPHNRWLIATSPADTI